MDHGLRQVLESQTLIKLLWDCRGDAEVLRDTFDVALTNVVDIQILYYEKHTPGNDRLPGFVRALEDAPIASVRESNGAVKIKRQGKETLDRMDQRPLTEALVNYCAVDIMYLHRMWYGWSNVLEEDHLAHICSWRLGQGRGAGPLCDFKHLLEPEIKRQFDPEVIDFDWYDGPDPIEYG